MDDPQQTGSIKIGRIEIGEIESMASRAAKLVQTATNPQIAPLGSGRDVESFASANEQINSSNEGSHPWKVTSNGDGTVSVSAGELLSFEHESVLPPAGTGGGSGKNLSSYFNLDTFATYDGGDSITVTGTGFIYAQVDFANGGAYVWDAYTNVDGVEVQVNLDSIRPSGVVTVAFGTSLPTSGDVFVVKLAEVALSDGVAQVNKQIITHNPTLFTQSITGQDVTP